MRKNWNSADILSWGNDGWLWGERCSISVKLNKLYFECTNGEKAKCEEFNTFVAELKKRDEQN